MKEWIKYIIICVIQMIFILIAKLIVYFAPQINDMIWFVSGLIAASIYIPILRRRDYESDTNE